MTEDATGTPAQPVADDPHHGEQATSVPFGGPAGVAATLFTLRSATGLIARVTDHGATLVELHVPDRDGCLGDVVLGYPDVARYRAPSNPYLGATVGRVANRIANGRFDLDGRTYTLACNEPPHHLHGGATRSFDKVRWDVLAHDTSALTLRYVAPDGEEGYPGQVTVTATYRLVDDALVVAYQAVTDAPTLVNLTNHAYLNLRGAGSGDVLDHHLEVAADLVTEVDHQLIPTGVVREVADGPLDLRSPQPIGARLPALADTPGGAGVDHNFVLRGDTTDPEPPVPSPAPPSDGRREPDEPPATLLSEPDEPPATLHRAAWLWDPSSGRTLDLATDQPCLQVYTGQQLADPPTGKGGARYGPYAGLCLEPQRPPDAIHHPAWPSVVLRPGQRYRHVSRYRFGTR